MKKKQLRRVSKLRLTCKKHSVDFDPIKGEGCPQCIKERRRAAGIRPEQDEMEDELNSEGLTLVGSNPELVKVRYVTSDDEAVSSREYTYYSEELLNVGDIIMVPVRDTTAKAKVSAIDVSEAEILAFKDKVKTIPAGSKLTVSYRKPDESVAYTKTVQEALDQGAQEITVMGEEPKREIGMVSNGTEIPEGMALVEVAPGKDIAVLNLLHEAQQMIKYAQERTIATQEDVKDATNDLSMVAKLKKAIEVERKRYVDPLNAELKEINTFFKTLTEPIGEADQITRRKVLDYNAEIARQREEAERIEAEKLRLAQDEMKLKGEYTVDLTEIEKPDATPDRVRTEVGTASKMTVRKWELEDITQVPSEYLLVDTGKVTKLVKAGIGAISGIRIWEEETLQIRSR